MIRAIIRFSAHNRCSSCWRRPCAVAYGLYTLQHIPLDAIPDLSDTQVIVYSRWDRSPDIIEDQVTYPIVIGAARRAEGQDDPRLLGLRLLLRLRDLRGRHRHLLGAQPRARVPVQDPAAAARGRHDGARARRDRRRLGLPVRARRRLRHALARGPAHAPGLEPPLPRCSRCRAWPRSRRIGGFVQQYQVTVDPEPAARPTDLAIMERGRGRSGAATARSAAGWSSWRGREYMVRGRGYVKSMADLEQIVLKTDAARHAGPAARRRRRSRSAPRCGAASRTSTARARSVGGIVVMRHGENALRRHRPRQGAAEGARAVAARRASRS